VGGAALVSRTSMVGRLAFLLEALRHKILPILTILLGGFGIEQLISVQMSTY
jgi:hypothetical protein